MFIWTNEEIEKILKQLDDQAFPFKKYSFTRRGDRLHVLGKGAFALVYEAQLRTNRKNKYVIKVIGFGDKHVDSVFFTESVEAQINLGIVQENVVKVYDYEELFVWLDSDNNVTGVEKAEGNREMENCLKLQFIVMEKTEAVLTKSKSGKIKLSPNRLAVFDETEIVQVAYDIANALSVAHQKKILHRDVKLENIFYDSQKKCYKLGDFGIAKVTDDGMAETVTFTKGYGAPEVVGSLDEKYDNTADIYSLGILIYVLLNGLKFPEAKGYSANTKVQYSQGYVLPEPERCSQELYKVVEKMCMYNPDDRYQSMDEVLDDLERMIFDSGIYYKKMHKNASRVIGTVFLLLGTVGWKLCFMPELEMGLSLPEYVFLALMLGQAAFYIRRKSITCIRMALLVLGIYLLVTNGFSWFGLIFLICVFVSEGAFSGLSAGSILIAKIVNILQTENIIPSIGYSGYSWMAILLLSLAVFLLYQYFVLSIRNLNATKIFFKWKLYWLGVSGFYMLLLMNSWGVVRRMIDWFGSIVGGRFGEFILSQDVIKVGIGGIAFCVAWIVREQILRIKETHIDRNYYRDR